MSGQKFPMGAAFPSHGYSAIKDTGDIEIRSNRSSAASSPSSTNSFKRELKQLKNTKIEDLDDPAGKYFSIVLVGLIVYIWLSSEIFSYLDGKTRLDAVYLSIITFTTIGYGDLTPSHPISKLYCCGFIFLNMLIVGQLLNFVVETMIERRKKENEELMKNAFDKEDDAAAASAAEADGGMPIEPEGPWMNAEYRLLYDALVKALVLIFGTLFVGTLFFSFLLDDHTIINGIYLSCMTISTVGYGDVVPSNDNAKAFGCFYAIAGTLVFGSAVSSFCTAVADFRVLAKNELTLNNNVLDYETFMKADVDGSDSVSKSEFVLFRLTQMGIIPQHLRERAEQQFDRMDADGSGDLTMEDIILHRHASESDERKQRLLEEYRKMKARQAAKRELEKIPAARPAEV